MVTQSKVELAASHFPSRQEFPKVRRNKFRAPIGWLHTREQLGVGFRYLLIGYWCSGILWSLEPGPWSLVLCTSTQWSVWSAAGYESTSADALAQPIEITSVA